jgi:hypothetical protein
VALKPFACLIRLHRFSVWVKRSEGKVARRRLMGAVPVGEPVEVGDYVVQERQCLDCGRLQLRTVETSL